MDICQILLRIVLPIYEILFIVPIIGLPLEIHNLKCILHIYSSTIEISFFKLSNLDFLNK
jgi:hypothetical protein